MNNLKKLFLASNGGIQLKKGIIRNEISIILARCSFSEERKFLLTCLYSLSKKNTFESIIKRNYSS